MAGSTLYCLPGEVRNSIFRYAIVSAAPRHVEPLCEPDKPKLHQPALAFTCRLFRNEALSIFYAEHKWFLGKIGYHDPTDIRLYDFNLRLQRWLQMLGQYSKYLTCLSMSIDGLCYAWHDGVIPGDATYELSVAEGGALQFKMNNFPRCTCRLKAGVVDSAKKDGAILLRVFQEYSASYCEAVKEGRCEQCGLSRLEHLGRTEVTHQKYWTDIITA